MAQVRRPSVDVLARLDHLWREVVQRAAEGLAPGARGVHRPAEVGDLELALLTCNTQHSTAPSCELQALGCAQLDGVVWSAV